MQAVAAKWAQPLESTVSTVVGQPKRIGDDFRPAQYYIEAWGYEIGAHGSVPYTPNAKVQSPKRRQPGTVSGAVQQCHPAGLGRDGSRPAEAVPFVAERHRDVLEQ